MPEARSYLPTTSDQLDALFLVENDEFGDRLRGRGVATDQGAKHPGDGELALFGGPAAQAVSVAATSMGLHSSEEAVEGVCDRNAALGRGHFREPRRVGEG